MSRLRLSDVVGRDDQACGRGDYAVSRLPALWPAEDDDRKLTYRPGLIGSWSPEKNFLFFLILCRFVLTRDDKVCIIKAVNNTGPRTKGKTKPTGGDFHPPETFRFIF